MIDKVIFDTDGVVIRREMYFSACLTKDYGTAPEKILPFFKNEFQQCLIGQADLKEELKKYISSWDWTGTIDQLLAYWFKNESDVDRRILHTVQTLRTAGIHCYLDTNNEKYRTEFLRETLKLSDSFENVFSSSELGYAKPSLEFWKTIHQRLGQPEKTSLLVWDDEAESVKSAQDFGFHAELYTGFGPFQTSMQTWLSPT
ncbi:MAG: HAD hydrolase-like protein [Patescibacteria group bacterium]|jgi:putative hydrolase of the HAD superfamily